MVEAEKGRLRIAALVIIVVDDGKRGNSRGRLLRRLLACAVSIGIAAAIRSSPGATAGAIIAAFGSTTARLRPARSRALFLHSHYCR